MARPKKDRTQGPPHHFLAGVVRKAVPDSFSIVQTRGARDHTLAVINLSTASSYMYGCVLKVRISGDGMKSIDVHDRDSLRGSMVLKNGQALDIDEGTRLKALMSRTLDRSKVYAKTGAGLG